MKAVKINAGFILGQLIFTALVLAIYFLVYLILEKSGKLYGNILFLFGFFKGGLFTFWLIGTTYKIFWSPDVVKNRPLVALLMLVSAFILSYGFLKLVYENNQLYRHAKDHKRKGFEGNIHAKDPELGYRQVRNAKGFITSKYRDKIPLRIDENGFRVPFDENYKPENDTPLILFLGCSNTFGNLCYAKETFSYIVSDSLNCRYINAGVCGYGLSQMYILAKKLIPKHKPDFVVAQYSDWLTQRTIKGFAPTYLIDIPNPYFTEIDGSIVIRPPNYTTDIWEMTIWNYDGSKSNFSNYLDFSFSIGLSNLLRNYYLFSYNKITKGHKVLKKVEMIENFVYNEIYQIAKEHKSQLIVLNIGASVKGEITNKSHEYLKYDDVLFAEADSVLWGKADYNFETYMKLFHHWALDGKDSVRIDSHPNHLSHSLIAKSILNAIKSTQEDSFNGKLFSELKLSN